MAPWHCVVGCVLVLPCHCYFEEPWASSLSPMKEDELDLLEDLESFREGQSRLSCQVEMTEDMDGVRVEVAPDE